MEADNTRTRNYTAGTIIRLLACQPSVLHSAVAAKAAAAGLERSYNTNVSTEFSYEWSGGSDLQFSARSKKAGSGAGVALTRLARATTAMVEAMVKNFIVGCEWMIGSRIFGMRNFDRCDPIFYRCMLLSDIWNWRDLET
jgi:hypothetical protein